MSAIYSKKVQVENGVNSKDLQGEVSVEQVPFCTLEVFYDRRGIDL